MIGLGQTLSLTLGPPGVTTPPFAGPLDAYAADALALWGLSHRLLTSYRSALFRVRRTGDDEMDIAAKSNGMFDLAALNGFVGTDPWWFSQFYDQTGNGIHLTYAATGQPRGGVDGNGLVYAYAETGLNEKAMANLSLNVAATDTTHWDVFSSPSYILRGNVFHDTVTDKARGVVNFGNSIALEINYTDGSASMTPANTGLYSSIAQIGGWGNRLNIGTSVVTGTKASSPLTINTLAVGLYAGWNPEWAVNAFYYAGGLWTTDVGDVVADAIQAIGKELYHTQ